jgi:hypothetical protein
MQALTKFNFMKMCVDSVELVQVIPFVVAYEASYITYRVVSVSDVI